MARVHYQQWCSAQQHTAARKGFTHMKVFLCVSVIFYEKEKPKNENVVQASLVLGLETQQTPAIYYTPRT